MRRQSRNADGSAGQKIIVPQKVRQQRGMSNAGAHHVKGVDDENQADSDHTCQRQNRSPGPGEDSKQYTGNTGSAEIEQIIATEGLNGNIDGIVVVVRYHVVEKEHRVLDTAVAVLGVTELGGFPSGQHLHSTNDKGENEAERNTCRQ